MKSLINLFVMLVINTISLSSQDAVELKEVSVAEETCNLTVELINLSSDEGELAIGLYNSEETWLGSRYKGAVSKVVDGKATVMFADVPYGIYAVSAIHDKDMNNKLNTGLFGIPSEPYASSRGAKGIFGPPKWSDAKFTLDTATSTEQIIF